ncbi:MAG: protein BatD, partial [Fimbriimonadaceae bacterium]|nr:protein BatD [Chitinophagales bacterium]
ALLLISVQLFAQTNFTATVNKNKVGVSERFTLSFTISNCDGKNFKAPVLSDFYVVGGPNQSSQISMINGKTTQSVSFNYALQPKSIGKFTIGSASIKCGNDNLTSQPITIEVTEAPVTQNNNSSDQATDLNKYVKENYFIKTEVSEAEIYRGEETTITFKLYINRNSAIADHQVTGMNKVPKFNGFYADDIDVSNSPPTYETINGQSYVVYIIKKTVLTAQQAGDLEVDPFSIDAIVAVKTKSKKKSRDPFEDFFGDSFPDPFSNKYENVNISTSSPTVKIKVNDLPPNAPSDFNGAVGNFTMQTELNNTETKTDEPLTYRVIINGTGNLNLFEAPVLNLPPGWETYDPEITEADNSRIFEYLLIPRSPGEFTIPAHTWSYFNPSKKQYVTLTSQSYNVNIEEGPNYTGIGTGVNKEDVQMLAEDIRFINKDEPEFLSGEDNLAIPLFYSAIGLPFLLGAFIFFSTAKRNKLESNVVALKNKRATAIAKKRLKQAEAFAKKNESKAFYNEAIRALWGYLEDKFNIPKSTLSKENISSYLNRYHVSETIQHDVLQLLDECELALFAPQSASGSLSETHKKAIKIITQLEAEIRE